MEEAIIMTLCELRELLSKETESGSVLCIDLTVNRDGKECDADE